MHDPLDFWSQLQTGAWRFDFFSALRCVDALDPRAPRLGTSNHLHQDPLRLGQAVSLGFEPGMLRNLQLREGQAARLAVTFFGLTGVNGPMPLAFSEDVLSRQINHNDFLLADFLDIFHHRLLCLLYRSWAVTRPAVSADRPGQDRFADYVQAFTPRGERYYAAQYVDQRRSAEGLLAVLRDHLQMPVRLQQWFGRWSEQTALQQPRLGGAGAAQLGHSALLGRRVWNAQHSVRLVLGPLTIARLEQFLSAAALLQSLTRLVDDYLGSCFEWDVQLLIADEAEPAVRLGANQALGLASWLPGTSRSLHSRACVLSRARLHRLQQELSHD